MEWDSMKEDVHLKLMISVAIRDLTSGSANDDRAEQSYPR